MAVALLTIGLLALLEGNALLLAALALLARSLLSQMLARDLARFQAELKAASETAATARALAASRMPKPTPTGSFTCALMRGIIAATALVSRCPAPVTPFR